MNHRTHGIHRSFLVVFSVYSVVKKTAGVNIMPDHIHYIVKNVVVSVGADPRVCPGIAGEHNMGERTGSGRHAGLPLQSGEHIGSPVHWVMQWFKTMGARQIFFCFPPCIPWLIKEYSDA